MVDWPEVCDGIEEAATCAVTGLGWVLLAGCPDERWCAQSTRLRGQAVGRLVFHLDVSFLDALLTATPFRVNEFCWSEWPLFILVTCCPAWLVGRAGRRGSLNVVPLAGALKWAVRLAEVHKDGGSERVPCCGG